MLPVLVVTLQFNFEGTVGMRNNAYCLSFPALLMVALTTLKGVVCTDVETHLEMGNKMLASGQLADALTHYHAAIDLDPKNYKSLYRRATVYLALGKSKSALPDLDKVVELKPDFTAARVQRGSVKLKQGKLKDAQIDYEKALEKEPSNTIAKEGLDKLLPLYAIIEEAKSMVANGEHLEAIELLSHAIEICPWDPVVHELRADCYEATGDFFKAVSDIKPTTKLIPDNTKGYYRLSKLYYVMGEADESLNEIRECLKLDPDHKECHKHYKVVKKLVKQIQAILDFRKDQNWDDCIQKVQQMQKTESSIPVYINRALEHNCHCHSKAGHSLESLQYCGEVLKDNPQNVDALCDRAEAYIFSEKYEEAIKDYKAAEEISGDNRRAQEGLKRANKLLKQSLKRDYYKILGVPRNAKKKEILKAYRKLASEWHPDKHEEANKPAAEKKFLDIAAAKEVLTDPEKRQKFDNGEDPLDPEAQNEHQGGGHPFFHQGFNPFGSGGFTFTFRH